MAELENTNLTNNIDNEVSEVMPEGGNPNLSGVPQSEAIEQTPLQENAVSEIGYEDSQNSETVYQESAETLQNQGMIQIPEISQNEDSSSSEGESQVQGTFHSPELNQEPIQIPAVSQNENEGNSGGGKQSGSANESMITIPNLSNDITSPDNESNNADSEQVSEPITPSPEASEENQQNVAQNEPTSSAEATVTNAGIQAQNSKNEQQEKLVKIIKLREGKAKKVGFSMGMLTGIVVVVLVGVASVILAKDQIVNLLQNGLGDNSGLSANVVDLADNNQTDENVVADDENIEENEDIAENGTDSGNQGDDESQLREFYLDQLNNILAMEYDNQSTIEQLNEMLQEVKSYENPDQELISLIVGEIEYFEVEAQKESGNNETKDNKLESDGNITDVDENTGEKSDESNVIEDEDNNKSAEDEDETDIVKDDSQQDEKSEEDKGDLSDENEIANSSETNDEVAGNQQDDESSDNKEVKSNKEEANDSTSSSSEGDNKTPEQDSSENELAETTDGVIAYIHVDNPEKANRVMSPNCTSLSCGDYTQIKKENLVLCKSFQLKEDMDDSSHRISNSGVCRYRDLSELVHLDL